MEDGEGYSIQNWRPGIRLHATLFLTAVVLGFGTFVEARSEISAVVRPSTNSLDPGPDALLQDRLNKRDLQFGSMDLLVHGLGSFRIYFDFTNNRTFHFADRADSTVTLGICEGGVEQVFSSGPLSVGGDLRIARHGSNIAVFQGHTLICSAIDDRQAGGGAGFRMLAAGPAVQIQVKARAEIHYSEDFMTSDSHLAQWRGNGSPEKGDFAVMSLKNPLLSANPFCYMGDGQGIYSVVGESWWDSYSYQAALRGPADSKIGLVFAYHDEKNYGLFRWSARSVDPAGVTRGGTRELIRVADGKETVLASSEGGYEPQQWYAASIRVNYAHVSVTVDGHALLDAADPALTAGGAGVWCDVALPAKMALSPRNQAYQYNSLNDLMKQHAVFDDVKINSIEGFEEQFRTPGALASGWLVGAGDWNVQATKGAPGELAVTPPADGVAKALIGERRWGSYQVEADVLPGSGSTGLIILHRDESSYYSATIAGDELRLGRVASTPMGVEETIVDAAQLARSDGPVHLKATVKRGHIKVTAKAAGNLLGSVETFDSAGRLKGRAGLLASLGARAARFSNFILTFVHDTDPLITTNAVFEDEATMNDWANPTSEWRVPKDPVLIDGKPVNLRWHRSQFPGDVEMAVEPRDFTETTYEIALSLAASGQGKNNGYTLRYRPGDSAEGASRSTTAQIFRQGEKVAESVLPGDSRKLTSLSLRRCGKYVVAAADGTPILTYRDERPLTGSQIAYCTKGVTLRTEAIKISSNNFRDELFSSAPTLWRIAGDAIANVTCRWQCEPRWTFFSLESEVGKRRPAVMWNKALYPGDVSLEFFVATKMEGERGVPYSYARDINVTICSDGADVGKGYTFMFGGFNNSGSMILRHGVEAKRSARPVVIPTDMNFSRSWFHVFVEKRGSRLSFRVDRYFEGEKDGQGHAIGELAYDDPQPLSGNRIALWTFNNAIMISRVRISGDDGETLESPEAEIQPVKTFYDAP